MLEFNNLGKCALDEPSERIQHIACQSTDPSIISIDELMDKMEEEQIGNLNFN